MNVPPAPERRWLRFSLRALFVVITLFGCWLGYQMNWIHQRRAIIGDPNILSSTYHYETSQPVTGPAIRRIGYTNAPWPLGWLGEIGYSNILLEMGTSNDELARVRRLFPETGVEVDEP